MKIIEVNIEQIMALCNAGFSERQIADRLNVSRSTIHNRIYNIHYNLGNRKRFSLNECFFSKSNDLNSYWAGFIAADGNIYKNTLSIEIHKKDKNHLEKFRKCVEYNGVIYKRKNRDIVNLRVYSKKIIEDLEKNFNVISCKSKILQPPILVEESHIKNFIRGYIDGDGSYANKYNILSIRGTFEILEWIQNNLNKYSSTQNKSKILFDSGIYKLQIQGRIKYKNVVNWLFKGASNFSILERKYFLVKNLVSDPIEICFNNVEIKNYKDIEQNILIDRETNMLKKDIASKYNISTSHVTNILKKHGINHLDRRKLSKNEVIEIKNCLDKLMSHSIIAQKFGVNKGTIYEISKGITWKNI